MSTLDVRDIWAASVARHQAVREAEVSIRAAEQEAYEAQKPAAKRAPRKKADPTPEPVVEVVEPAAAEPVAETPAE